MTIPITETRTLEIPDEAIQAIVDAYLLAHPPGGGGGPSITLDSGTYTPTIAPGANVASTVAYLCQYLRVGNVVHVGGFIDVDPVAANVLTTVGISLPIASNFSDVNGSELAGIAGNTTEIGSLVGDPTNDRATMYMMPKSAVAQRYPFTFTYRVI